MCISTSAFAAQITGTASNGTTNKPAAGDEVVLLSLAAGMDETAHTKTDAQGRFTVNVPDEGVQHLVRVIHQGVNYYRAAPPGTTSAEITVYDAAKEVPNILQESRVLRLQTKDGQIEVSEAYTLRNESQPPRTKNGDQTFEVTIPDGAILQDGMVALDPETGAIKQIITELADSMEDLGLRSFRTEVDYDAITFPHNPKSYWLPAQATVELNTARQHWKNVHHFSAYRLFSVNVDEKVDTDKLKAQDQ